MTRLVEEAFRALCHHRCKQRRRQLARFPSLSPNHGVMAAPRICRRGPQPSAAPFAWCECRLLRQAVKQLAHLRRGKAHASIGGNQCFYKPDTATFADMMSQLPLCAHGGRRPALDQSAPSRRSFVVAHNCQAGLVSTIIVIARSAPPLFLTRAVIIALHRGRLLHLYTMESTTIEFVEIQLIPTTAQPGNTAILQTTSAILQMKMHSC